MKFRTILLAGAAGMAPFGPGVAAHATDDQATQVGNDGLGGRSVESLGEPELVVTAQRREERLVEVPISVGVVNEVQLQQSRVQEVADLVAITPGVSFASSTVRGGGFRIRGVGSTAGSGEPSVAYVVDGVVFADQASALDQSLLDVQRVEVLRGPQGTLFGKNASSGVINIATKAPTRDFELWSEGSIGEFGEREVRAGVSGPIGSEVGFRISGTHREFDGNLVNNFTGERSGGVNQDSVRAKVRWQRGIGTVTLIADYSDRQDYGLLFTERASTDPNRLDALAAYGVVPSVGNRFQAFDVPTYAGRKSGGVSLQVDLDIGRHTLTSISAWRLSNNTPDGLDADGLPISTQPVALTLANSYNELLVEAQHADTGRNEQLSQELRIASPTGGKIEYVAGLYSLWNKDRSGTFRTASQCVAYGPTTLTAGPASPLIQVPAPIAACNHPDPTRVEIIARATTNDGNTTKTENLAAFGQFSLRILDTVKLIGGLRYTAEEREAQVLQGTAYNQTLTFLTTATGPVRAAFNTALGRPATTPITAGTVLSLPDSAGTFRTLSRSDDNLSGRAGIQFQPSRDLNFYATYARGYKGPALNIGTGIYTNPEKSNAYEVGMKAQLFGRKLNFNLSGFLTDFTGFQANAFDSTLSRYVVVNAGDVRTQGFEADIIAEPFDGFSLTAALTYARARIRDFNKAGQCYPGQPIANGTANPVAAPPSDGQCYIIGGTAAAPIYGQSVNGGRLPGSTDWKAFIGGRYVHPIGGSFYAMIGANYTWQSEALFDLNQDPGTRQKPYGVFDLNLGFGAQDRKWSITLFAKNLFDERFASTILTTPTAQVNVDSNLPTSTTVPATANPSAGNYIQILPRNAFRQFGATLRVRFGAGSD